MKNRYRNHTVPTLCYTIDILIKHRGLVLWCPPCVQFTAAIWISFSPTCLAVPGRIMSGTHSSCTLLTKLSFQKVRSARCRWISTIWMPFHQCMQKERINLFCNPISWNSVANRGKSPPPPLFLSHSRLEKSSGAQSTNQIMPIKSKHRSPTAARLGDGQGVSSEFFCLKNSESVPDSAQGVPSSLVVCQLELLTLLLGQIGNQTLPFLLGNLVFFI